MTECQFYHLQGQHTEQVLPELLEKSLQRGCRVTVQCSAEERVDALDAHLWTFREDSFLPHGTFREASAAEQPVLLTIEDHNPNGATVRFLVDGAQPPADAERYEHVVILFDGDNEQAVVTARQWWQDMKARGFALSYWQADPQGRWQRRA
jgi:DNA polymerase III subunit chi